MHTHTYQPTSRLRICRSPSLFSNYSVCLAQCRSVFFGELIFRAWASILFRLHAAFSGSGEEHCDSEAFCALDKSDEKSLLWKICFGIWILAGVLSIPGHSTTTRKKIRWIRIPQIQPLFGLTLLTQLTHLFTSVVFDPVLPCTVMIFCYSRVIYHVWLNNEANAATNAALLQPRSKLRKLFILVTTTFIVSRTPIFVIQILTQLVRNGNSWKLKLFLCHLLCS